MARKTVIGLLALLVACAGLCRSAQAADKYAGEFLTHGVGARALGMGSAFVAVADDVTAGYWNPAGVAEMTERAVQFMHSETFGDVVNYDTGAYVHPLEEGSAIALTYVRLAVDDIPFTDFEEDEERIYYDPARISWESDSESALFVTYGRKVSPTLRLGASLKMIRKSIAEYSCYGFGFDIGAKYDLWNGFTLGANIQDVTTTYLAWDTKEKERIWPTAKLGVAYSRDIASLDGRVIAAADADVRFEKRWMADEYHIGDVTCDTHYGLEFVYRNAIAVRTGFAMSELTAGAGIGFRGFVIDYAYGRHEYLDSSHRVSASYEF
ncbi:PorV/PorQ family protein [bacterium]|nr:PorV/PorQ family protein [bacterium]